MGVISDLVKDYKVPKMAKVRQIFSSITVEDVPVTVKNELGRSEIANTIKPGMKIAITAGSRGIRNMETILKETVAFVKEKGGEPFVIPAMGSHGGATAEGQLEVLESLGITEEFLGCPIKATMETKKIGQTPEGHNVLIDKYAAEADGIIVVNRVKLHTCFRGPYESGIMKMMTIGLGKQKGADVCHASGFKHMARLIPLFGNSILKHANILFAVATIENAFDETYKIVGLTPSEIPEKEPELLKEAKEMMPRIQLDETDVLIVDKIGKNISGSGMDPNVSGVAVTPYASGGIKSSRVVVLDLTDETHGSAVGMGSANFTTKRLFNKIDFDKTYPNVLTSGAINNVRIPMILNSDKEAIQAAIRTAEDINRDNPRIIRIKNTLDLGEIYVSEALLEEVKKNPNLEIIEEPKEIPFDEDGNLW